VANSRKSSALMRTFIMAIAVLAWVTGMWISLQSARGFLNHWNLL
jgi:hypothetical protein